MICRKVNFKARSSPGLYFYYALIKIASMAFFCYAPNMQLSIIFALVSLVAYAFGDFFTQKSVRKIGTIKNLFFFGIIGALILTPFIIVNKVYRTLNNIHNIWPIILFAIVIILANLFDFEALKKGRFAVIQPVYSIELPFIIILSILVLGEKIYLVQWLSIILIFIGLVLTVSNKFSLQNILSHKNLEKGAFWALLSAAALALSALLITISSRATSPLLIAWIAQMALCIFGFCYTLFSGTLKELLNHFKKNKTTVLLQGALQDLAIVSFAFATLYGKLSIAAPISENYVVLSVFIGVVINKDRIDRHQKIGVGLSIVGLLILSILDKGMH